MHKLSKKAALSVDTYFPTLLIRSSCTCTRCEVPSPNGYQTTLLEFMPVELLCTPGLSKSVNQCFEDTYNWDLSQENEKMKPKKWMLVISTLPEPVQLRMVCVHANEKSRDCDDRIKFSYERRQQRLLRRMDHVKKHCQEWNPRPECFCWCAVRILQNLKCESSCSSVNTQNRIPGHLARLLCIPTGDKVQTVPDGDGECYKKPTACSPVYMVLEIALTGF